jgi:hypothetical protein
MADWGVKVSVPGSDVLTAADKDLVYSTKYNGMKILKHDTQAGSGSLAHGVSGYIPTFLNYVASGGKYRIDSAVINGSATYATTTNIVFGTTSNYYFIFVDRGN